MSLKDKFYDFWVRKNKNVQREYETYVRENINEHYTNRIRHWKMLWKLTVHYRIKKKTVPMLWNQYVKSEVTVQDKLAPQTVQQRRLPVKSNNDNVAVQNKTASQTVQQGRSPAKPINDRFPCVNGPESEEVRRQPFFRLALDLLEYDLISFDIFDTLLLRPFKTPQDLFYIVGHKLNFSGYHMDFTTLRASCEKNARVHNLEKYGYREITISDIYNELATVTNIDPEVGTKVEFETELEYCMPNPYMLEVFKILKSFKKKIVITSDMYYSSEQLSKMLKKIGIEGYEKLYVSCEHKINKYAGLFDVVLNDYSDIPVSKIAHVGDNIEADIKPAQKRGISTKHYLGVNVAGAKHRPKTMSNVIGSFYGGLVNAHIHAGKNKYSVAYEYGYIYAGLYIMGMVNWINKKVLTDKYDQIIFLARDGYIYKKVFDMFYGNVDTEYCLWSRHSAMHCDVAEHNYEEFLRRYLVHRIDLIERNLCEQISVGVVLDGIGIKSRVREKLTEYGLHEYTQLSRAIQDNMRRFLLDYREEIIQDYKKEKENLIEEYTKTIGEHKKIAFVDMGWTGNNVISLIRMLSGKLVDTEMKCFLAGCLPSKNLMSFLDGTIETYLFSMTENKQFHSLYTNGATGVMNTLAHEIMNQTYSPSFISQTDEGVVFDIPQVEDYDTLKQIENGIIDFCKDYWKVSSNCPVLRNISANDAMAPILLVMNSKDYIIKNLGHLHMAAGIGKDKEGEGAATISSKYGGK